MECAKSRLLGILDSLLTSDPLRVKELLPSCKTKVTEGMEVWTKTPRVQANQYQCIKKTYENVVDKYDNPSFLDVFRSVFERTEMNTLLRSQIEQSISFPLLPLTCR